MQDAKSATIAPEPSDARSTERAPAKRKRTPAKTPAKSAAAKATAKPATKTPRKATSKAKSAPAPDPAPAAKRPRRESAKVILTFADIEAAAARKAAVARAKATKAANKGKGKAKAKRDPDAPKNRGGRPPHEPSDVTRHTVEIMSASGTPQDDIAAALMITANTLRKHYAVELATGGTRIKTRVADALIRQALAGNVHAQKFYLERRAGWTPTATLNVGGRVELDVQALSDEALLKIASGADDAIRDS